MSLRNIGGILSATKTGLNTPVEQVEYLVVAGGGGAGHHGSSGTSLGAGGGGAGGLLTGTG